MSIDRYAALEPAVASKSPNRAMGSAAGAAVLLPPTSSYRACDQATTTRQFAKWTGFSPVCWTASHLIPVPDYLHANPILLGLIKKFGGASYQRLVGYAPGEIPPAQAGLDRLG